MTDKFKGGACKLAVFVARSVLAVAALVWLSDRLDSTEYFRAFTQPYPLVDVDETSGDSKPHVGPYPAKGKIWYNVDRYCPQDITVDVTRRVMRGIKDAAGKLHTYPVYTFKPVENINVAAGAVENNQPVDTTDAAASLMPGDGYYIETYIHVHTRDTLGKGYTTRTDIFSIK